MKYSDYLKIDDNFQYSINLQFDIGNINKVKDYIPTSDSCEIMEFYIDSLLGNFSKSTALIGPYGKGKSHLLLIILTLLNDYNVEDNEVINELMIKINNINNELYEKIMKIRNKGLKYLPVIINSNYNNMNQAFLLAMNEALERDKISDLNIETYFSNALGIIETWKKNNDLEVLEKFNECLIKNDTTMNQLIEKLKNYDDIGYKSFKEVYKCVMHGVEFNPLINSDVVKYYKDVNYKICQNGYNGILIIFDEFSKFLEYVGNESIMKDLKMIQDFAELASRTGKNEQIIFSCITHKAINEYTKGIKDDKINAFKTVEGRFKEIYFNRSIEQNYEIIAQTIKRKKNADKIIESKYLKNYEKFEKIKSLYKFFQYSGVELNLFKGCFPLNPLTVYTVINLSEKIAQNERTLFTFLTDDDTNSFKYFINNVDTEELFNVDKVYDYFYNILRKENDEIIKQTWMKAESALNKTEILIERKILKILAIIYMINDFDNLSPNEETIKCALFYNEKNIEENIEVLINKGIIKRKKSNGLLDFSTIYNKKILNDIENIAENKFNTIDIGESISKIVDFGYVIPRRYNQTYKMTRFFKELFITDEQLLRLKSFNLLKSKYFSDGIILNVIRSNETIDKIKEKSKEIKDELVIIKLSKKIMNEDIIKTLKELEAIEYINRTQKLDEDIVKELNLIKEDNEELVQNNIGEMFENENLEGIVFSNRIIKSTKINAICSDICEQIYYKTPKINNEMINKEEISSPIYKARNIVIDTLLDNNIGLIKSQTSAEATIYKAIVDKKDKEDIRIIISLIKKFIQNAEKEMKTSISNLVNKLIKPPYGIRKGVLPVLFSIAFQEYQDNIVLYYQNKEIELNSANISKMFDEKDKYYIYVEKGTKEKNEFIKKMSNLYNSDFDEMSRNNIRNIVISMKKWVLGLPRLTRELDTIDGIILEQSYIDIKNKLLRENLNYNEFLFVIIKKLTKAQDYTEIFKILNDFKNKYDSYVETFINKILINEFKERFYHNYKGNLNKMLHQWYDNIEEETKNTVINLQAKNIFEYIENLNTFNDIEIIQKMSIILIGIYVEDWQKNSIDDFFQNLDKTLNEIKNTKKADKMNQEIVTISAGGEKVEKYINSDDISPIGITMQNNIEDIFEEYGNSIDESEKIKILITLIKKYL